MINGLLRGRIGNQVYFVRNGKQYVRSAVKANKKRQPQVNQLLQQTALKLAGKFLKPLLPVVRFSFAAKQDLTGMNMAMRYALKHAVVKSAEGVALDPSKVLVSSGCVLPIASPRVSIAADTVTLEWESKIPFMPAKNDKVYLLAYNEGQQMIQLSSGEAMREAKALAMKLNDELQNGSFHLYAFASDRLHAHYSNSQYLGKYQPAIHSQD